MRTDKITWPSGVAYAAKKPGDKANMAPRVTRLMIVTCRTTTYGFARSVSIARRPFS